MLSNFLKHIIPHSTRTRAFSKSSFLQAIPKKNKLPPRPKWLIKEDELEEKFLHGGRGAGGQKINKCNSKVQLKHIPTGLVVTCQYSRSKENNRKRARDILAAKLEDLQTPETSRNAVIAKRAQLVKQSKTKKANRKYKKLEEEKLAKEQQQEQEEEGESLKPTAIEDEFEKFLQSAKIDLSGLKK